MVQCVSINVNGLLDVAKFTKLCAICSENRYDIVALQETFWNPDFIVENKKHWNGEIFFSCSDTNRQGVAFLVSPKSKAYWAVEGDKNSKYFLQLEKYRQENNAIKELENDQGKLLTKSNDVLDEIQDYYKKSVLILRQGCPISALCYVIAAEPLVQAILKNKNIKRIAIPNSDKNSTVFAHADDFTFTVKDKQSIDETFKVLNNYSEASGAKINKQKSEIMCLGSGSISNQELTDYGIKQADEVTQILGIYMGKNSEICDYLNWDSKIKKAKSILYFWSKRELTLHARATILTSLIMSRFYYTLTVCPIPEKY
ncbi:unnamed protein product [Mytilus coruscus]|uniref:Uncharacterized protein n=1 Tax=Mytilus coruscus TaxID=42192 RepID=A0A6J8ESC9_MYTCO|nr:unnamed protein product [Mytilus coruscus]